MRRFWPVLLLTLMFIVSFLLYKTTSHQVNDTQASYQRIITLAPSITETAFALGLADRIVAVSDYSDYPPEAQERPSVGGYTNTSLEAIVRQQPDLVIMMNAQHSLQRQLKQLNIKTHLVDNSSIADIKTSILSIAEVTGQQKQAKKLLNDIQKTIDTVRQKVSGLPKVSTMIAIAHYVNSEQLNTLYIAGKNDFYNDLLDIAGGQNVYTNTSVAVPSISAEGVMRLNPDVILDIFPEAKDHQINLDNAMKQWQLLDSVNAVKSNRVYIIEHDYATVPGPRVFKLLTEMAQLLHPEINWQTENKHD